MRTRVHFINLALVFAMAACLVPCQVALAAQSILVNGVIHEQITEGNTNPNLPDGPVVTASDTWGGSLIGTGIVHIFSSEPTPPDSQLNIISERKLFTSDGNLFLSEVGEKHGPNIEVVSVVSGGTGIYKGATGTLTLTGVQIRGGANFVYSGMINLAD
jgi:hypothetical protein